MAQPVDGLYLNKYVDPQLLIERRNYRADFMQVLGSVPAGALAADGVRRNKLINNVGFRVNNTEDFEPKQMTGKNYIVPWEIYDTEPSSCTDDEIRYLAFDKRAAIRVKHNEAFQVGIRNHVLHKLAPEDDSNEEMPVIRTTGEKDINGRLRLSYKDLVDFATLAKTWNLPVTDALYMVLSPLHMGDLLLDKDASKYFYDRTFYLDPATGKPTGGWNAEELRTIQDYYVKYSLSTAEGMSEVASAGGFVKEYQIELNPDAMRTFNVSVMDIMGAIKKSDLDIGAETMEINKVEYLIRGLGYIKDVSDLEKAVVTVCRYASPM